MVESILMGLRITGWALLLLLASAFAIAQQLGLNGQPLPDLARLIERQKFDVWFLHSDWGNQAGKPENSSASLSKLDLIAPGKARAEYAKGFAELYRKHFNSAATHFEKAVSIFPKYFSAHNALGTAYMNLGLNQKARDEFQIAVSLDDHLPYSYSNLTLACLALQDYPGAVQAIQHAAAISPLDLKLPVLLAYAQLMNHEYPAVLTTAQKVHQRKHDQAAIVHYFAAVAQQSQNNLTGMRSELQLFLQEDPNGPSAEQARQVIAEIDPAKDHALVPETTVSYAPDPSELATPAGSPQKTRSALAQFELQRQLDSAECETCVTVESAPGAGQPARPTIPGKSRPRNNSPGILHSTVDEVGAFFAVTDGGRAVRNLSLAEVKLLDDRKAPAAVLDFRNESQLPLRLGLVIDTSTSITNRFTFEQDAATVFLQGVLTNKDDEVFVTSVADTVLMVQDFTNSKDDVSAALQKLAPAGGTALWDAVTFAARKLGELPETAPVARILVVVSDGEDNCSSATLKQAIETAQREQVTVYALSAKNDGGESWITLGDRALRALAQQTGGVVFSAGSLGHFRRSLNQLQEVMRSRYLISYKPAQFVSDGRYRSIEIAAQRSGHKLRVYTRKGYYASPKDNSTN